MQRLALNFTARASRAYCSNIRIGSTEYFKKVVDSGKVVVFMKGDKQQPQCGFSDAVVKIFNYHGVDFKSENVLADDKVREGIKKFTDWPTIPQVFLNGEFIGGCDILLQMHQNGDLVKQLAKIGITSEAPERKESETS